MADETIVGLDQVSAARFVRKELLFRKPAATSRNVMHSRTSWYIILQNETATGIGECAPIEGLSRDIYGEMENALERFCNPVTRSLFLENSFSNFPSIEAGIESALLDLKYGGKCLLFPSSFTRGEQFIAINGLVWMSAREQMIKEAEEKLKQGYRCIKIKIGALAWQDELEVLTAIRTMGGSEIEIRVDANGAFEKNSRPDFKLENAIGLMEDLRPFHLHSIEQPVMNVQILRELCRLEILPIALDESLIGCSTTTAKADLLDFVRPQFIVLKPTLLGGFRHCAEWIRLATETNTGWWVTSALESAIGLNAIAQWTATLGSDQFHGLGTGRLFSNNIPSPLQATGGELRYDTRTVFDVSSILQP